MNQLILHNKPGSVTLVILSLLVSLVPLVTNAADIEFFATVDRTTLSVTQTFTYTLQAEGSVSSLSDPELPDFAGFRILSGPNESSTFQIVNSKYSLIKSWSFVLKPEMTGALKINPARITHKKNTYQTETIEINVTGSTASAPSQPGSTTSSQSSGGAEPPELYVKIIPDKTTIYQNEQVVLSYIIYTRVSVTTYEISRMPSAPGFWTEEFKLPQQPTIEDEVISGRHYRRALIRKVALFPTRAGDLTIDPLEVTCQVQVQSSSGRRRDPFDMLFDSPFSRYRTEERFIETEPLKLKVLPLPAEGRSASFNGAVGSYSMDVRLDREEASTNEALTMTVTFSGNGNIKLLQQPGFDVPPDFEGYDPKESVKINNTGRSISGTKTFEYVLIPRVPGNGQIPSIEFTYFDPNAKSYKTITKGGFDVKIARGDGEAVAAAPGITREEVKLLAEDIHYLMTPGSMMQVGSAFRIPPAYWIAMILPPVIALLVFWIAKMMGAAALQARRRDRKSYAKATRELHLLQKNLSDERVSGEHKTRIYGEIHRILLHYIGQRLQIPASGLKEEEVYHQLNQFNVDAEVIKAVEEIFQECNQARFAPQQTDSWHLGRTLKRTVRVLDIIENWWGSQRSNRAAKVTKALIFIITTGSILASASAQSIDASDPSVAEDLYRAGDYTAAISVYEQVIDEGWTNGEIYYNLGNCYYKLGQYGRSILNYERAKQLLGNHPDLETNLRLANLRIYDRIEPLPRIFLIKIFKAIAETLTVRSWALLFLLAEWILLAVIICLYFIRKPAIRRILVWGFIISLMVSLTAGGFFVQQKLAKTGLVEAVVLTDSVEVRSAPESGSTELFTLHEGVKVEILRQVSGWAEIRLADGKQGWMPKAVFEII